MRKLNFLIITLALMAGCSSLSTDVTERVAVGDALPAFTIQLADGTTLHSRELSGKPALLVFFHTGCPDCRRTLPEVQKVYEGFGDRVRFVAISREQGTEDVQAWWDANGITLPFSAQTDRKVYELFAGSRIPRVYVADRTGTVRAVFDDNPCPDKEALEAAIQGVLP